MGILKRILNKLIPPAESPIESRVMKAMKYIDFRRSHLAIPFLSIYRQTDTTPEDQGVVRDALETLVCFGYVEHNETSDTYKLTSEGNASQLGGGD